MSRRFRFALALFALPATFSPGAFAAEPSLLPLAAGVTVSSAEPAAQPEASSGGPARSTEFVQERHPNGKIRVEREVTQDANDNFVNHGVWTMFNDRGEETARGEYRLGKRHGNWQRSHVALRELDLPFAPNAAGFKGPFLSTAQFQDGLLDGVWLITDLEDRKVVELHYSGDRRDGKCTWYFPNGNVWREVAYKQGVRDGQFVEYAGDGSVAKQYQYTDGARVVVQVEWYKKGQKKLEVDTLQPPEFAGTVDDWWAGSSRELAADLQRQSAPVTIKVVGVRHGGWKLWHASGQLAASGQFEHDRPVGKFEWVHANGQQACRGEYVQGQPVGVWTWWHANGSKEANGSLQTGSQIGKWLWWDDEGRVVKSAQFTDSQSGLQLTLLPEGIQPPAADIDAAETAAKRPTRTASTPARAGHGPVIR
ncbi:MAG: hypothetical protein JSS27_21030 [Planctomycetes bacterium]|nr:hypothetical protein [Planctomycetota bacterium]